MKIVTIKSNTYNSKEEIVEVKVVDKLIGKEGGVLCTIDGDNPNGKTLYLRDAVFTEINQLAQRLMIIHKFANLFKPYFKQIVVQCLKIQTYEMFEYLNKEEATKSKDALPTMYMMIDEEFYHTFTEGYNRPITAANLVPCRVSRVYDYHTHEFAHYFAQNEQLNVPSGRNIVLLDHDIVYGGQYKLLGDLFKTFGNNVSMLTYMDVNPTTDELLDIKDFIIHNTTPDHVVRSAGVYLTEVRNRVMYPETDRVLFSKLSSIPLEGIDEFIVGLTALRNEING